MNDSEVLLQLQSSTRRKAMTRLYKYYPQVKAMIKAKGGNAQDAEDVFQEGLIILCRKANESGFELTSSLDTYLYSVCKNLWNNQARKKRDTGLGEFEIAGDESGLEAAIQKEEKIKAIEAVLLDIGERCLQLLKAFYYQSLKMSEIARKMDFKSENVAKNQKYKCLEKARIKLREQV
jgi:RNA polymerase sigma factor (sigma-70 family)